MARPQMGYNYSLEWKLLVITYKREWPVAAEAPLQTQHPTDQTAHCLIYLTQLLNI